MTLIYQATFKIRNFPQLILQSNSDKIGQKQQQKTAYIVQSDFCYQNYIENVDNFFSYVHISLNTSLLTKSQLYFYDTYLQKWWINFP